MNQEIINVGTSPNDGLGDPIRTAFIKTNSNFTTLFAIPNPAPPVTLTGKTGDVPGMYAYDADYFYYCFATYDGVSTIWAKVAQINDISTTSISNGNSNVSVAANSVVTVSVANVANIVTFTSTGVTTTGNVSTGNILTNNYLYANGTPFLGTYGNTQVAAFLTTYTGNVSAGNVLSNNFLYANGAPFIAPNYGNSNVAAYLPTYTGAFSNLSALTVTGSGAVVLDPAGNSVTISPTFGGNVVINPAGVGGIDNMVIGNITPKAANFTTVSATGNVTGNYFIGNGSQLTGIAASSSNANALTGNTLSSNVVISSLTQVGTLANLSVNGAISTTGTVTANQFTGSGAGLTNIPGANVSGSVSQANYANTANAVAGSNVSGIVAQATQANYANTANAVAGANVSGSVSQANYANTANAVAGSNVSGIVAQATQANYANTANAVAGSNVSGIVAQATQANYANTANAVAGSNVSGIVAQATQANYANVANSVSSSNITGTVLSSTVVASSLTQVGTLTSLTVTGSIGGGNLLTNGVISTTGNVIGGSLVATVATLIGNVVGGNILTGGAISATGNIAGSYFIGNGSQLTGLPVAYSNSNVANYLTTYSNTFGNLSALNVTGLGAVILSPNGNSVTLAPTFSGTVVIAPTGTGSIDNMVIGNATPQSANFTKISATGNITASYFYGNGSQLTGLPTSYSNTQAAAYLSSGNVSTNILTTAAVSAAGDVTGNNLVGAIATASQPAITSVGVLSTLSVSGNISSGNHIPAANIAYSLGNSTNQWASLYVGNSSIYIGGVALSVVNGNLLFSGNTIITGNATGNNITANLTGTTTGLHNGLVNSFDIKALSWDFGYIVANTYTNPIQYLFAVTPAGNLDMGTITAPASLYIDIGSINASTVN